MGHQYAGTPSYATDFTVPDDGDAESAASVNVAFGALGDRTAYLYSHLSPRADVLTAASGTWTCPLGVLSVLIRAWAGGGGGGGGTGGDATTPTTRTAMGGAGGGGTRRTFTYVAVTPGTVYAYVNGAGGSFGVGSAAGTAGNSPGGDGADSTFNGAVIARGGGGGNAGGNVWSATTNQYPKVNGGRCVRSVVAPTAGKDYLYSTFLPALTAYAASEPSNGGQGGGYPLIAQDSSDGGCSVEGFAGGAKGAVGTQNTNNPGGGGGGGGAGPGGVGGAGGVGGNGTAAGAGTAGSGGANGAANTGAGGGGGGAGGEGSSVGGAGANGGLGGSGQMTIIYLGPQAVFT